MDCPFANVIAVCLVGFYLPGYSTLKAGDSPAGSAVNVPENGSLTFTRMPKLLQGSLSHSLTKSVTSR